MTSNARLALFDLDGTLVDSAPDLAVALQAALAAAELPLISEAETRDYIGAGAGRLVHRAITRQRDGLADEAVFEAVYAHFLAHYQQHVFVHSRVYAGATETLAALKSADWRLACVTNKPARFTAAVIEAAGFVDCFDIVISGDTLSHKKPHPQPLLHAARHCGAVAQKTIMIGDSATDMDAARNAGMRAVAVTYGYAGGIDLAARGASRLVAQLAQLPDLLAQMLEREAPGVHAPTLLNMR